MVVTFGIQMDVDRDIHRNTYNQQKQDVLSPKGKCYAPSLKDFAIIQFAKF